jgi:hypothetical protein
MRTGTATAVPVAVGQFVTKDSDQPAKAPKQFKLGHLGNLNQVIIALGKTIRAMADGNLDSQVGSRICNGPGIMRQCLETQALDRLGEFHWPGSSS